MVFKLDYIGDPKGYLVVSSLLPSAKLGGLLILCSLIPLTRYWYKRGRSDLNDLNRWVLFIASFVYSGVYVCSTVYTDEVFINLEHSWNLYHHGLFSFSPNRMIDGTVEIFYYFLLTPFAFGHEALIRANYLFGLLIGWLHLLLLWRLLSNRNLDFKLFLLMIFSINFPLIRIFSNGFGNSFISLLFFLSMYWQITGHVNKALIMASILPLLRPDAILYSLSVFLVDYICVRKRRLPHLGLLMVSVLTYFSLIKFMYGHWIPTPMHFKAFLPCMIHLINVDQLYRLVLHLIDPFHFLFLSVFAISLYQRNDDVKILSLYFLPLFIIFTFYSFTSFNPVSDSRYYAGFELYQAIFPVLYFDRRRLNLTIADQEDRHVSVTSHFFNKRLFLMTFSILIIFVLALNVKMRFQTVDPRLMRMVDNYGVGGQIMDEILPSQWAVAATELNTFGFMNNRDIIDLWGYTNPEIASSKMFSTVWWKGIRINPEFFLKVKPEVFWHRTERNDAAVDKSEIDDIENVLFGAVNINKTLNQLGDMHRVFALYDVVVLNTGEWVTQFFIQKGLTNGILRDLEDKGYVRTKSREIDQKKLSRFYEPP